jgi:osomolarity two-component system, sensor histidine kinase SLN1
VLLLGPARAQNRFSFDVQSVIVMSSLVNTTMLGATRVDYVFTPASVSGQVDRHDVYSQGNESSFSLSSYPAVFIALSHPSSAINNASSDLSTTNEQGSSVAVGIARPQSTLVDWVVIVEQNHDEAWTAVVELRNILVACVFGTAGLIALLVVPLAHFSVLPIRRLKDATEKSVQLPGSSETGSIRSQRSNEPPYISKSSSRRSARNGGVPGRVFRRGARRESHIERTENVRRRVFKIPGKVQEKKHFITDELTELTSTFNEMSDELMMQYAKLEERVAQRTQELEVSKKAAEAANESKTLFIANISHELKTPLNGILGMCAVCMGENDLGRVKKSLEVVYKSGDLLLHLLNDLLSFSKNQIGQALSLDEKEFGLSDIKSQVTNIFDKQVRERHINFGVNFVGTENVELSSRRPSEKPSDKIPRNNSIALGPPGTGKLKHMRLWGDQHRILQVIINLVNNSLKFTPEGGRVEVRIKCVGQAEEEQDSRRENSVASRQGSQQRSGIHSVVSRAPSNSATSSKPGDTALAINPMERTVLLRSMQVQERSPTPPLANARTLIFDFEVIDTGPGIPPNLQQRIFEPFVQGDLGLSKKYGGTGLGLSICSQLSTLMGGTITLESAEGIGSTFKMRIPLKFVKEVASSMTSSSLSESRPPSAPSSEEPRGVTIIPGDTGIANVAASNSATRGFEEDPQPRLVGLSQPFFAGVPPLSSSTGSSAQVQASDHVATSTRDRIRVLVAEDNPVNQEVVLR